MEVGSVKESSVGLALCVGVLLLVLLGAGCATPQAFVPVAEVTRAAPDGLHGAAEYQLDQPSRRAHVQVWSHGTYRDDTGGKAVTLVHVGFSISVLDEEEAEGTLQFLERMGELEAFGTPRTRP